VYIRRNIEARSWNLCCSGKTVCFTYCECVFVAVGILHVMFTPRTVICGRSSSLQRFSTLSCKQHDFRNKATHKMCVAFFCATFVWNISNCEENWARCDNKKRVLVFMCCTVLVIVGLHVLYCTGYCWSSCAVLYWLLLVFMCCTVLVIGVRNLNFLDKFLNSTEISNFT